ncbi:MAG TPA: SRPBCC domain-containing protein [Gammaproteobacteria bacterium]
MINLGLIIDIHTISLDCELSGPADRAWYYLTRPEGLRAWLAEGSIEPRTGGGVKLRFLKADAPVRSSCGALVHGLVARYEPYRLLAYSWMDASRDVQKPHFGTAVTSVSFTLMEREAGTKLRLVHSGLPPKLISKIGAGWHAHLSQLVACSRNDMPLPEILPAMMSRYERQAALMRMNARHV